MSITKQNKQELILSDDPPVQRASPYTLDQLYIQAYVQNPAAGKSAALIKAGFKGANVRQRAYELHKRLRRQIDQELTDMFSQGILIGMDGLKKLAAGAEQESVRAAACSKLVEYGHKYLPDKSRNPQRERVDIEADIAATVARIEAARGNPIK